jgi:hypothetical protein
MAAALSGLLLMAFTSFAQITTMEGTVTGLDGNPVQGAVINIVRTDPKAKYHVKTDRRGHYLYSGLPLSTYTVFVEVDGKETNRVDDVKTSASTNEMMNFDLRAEACHQDAVNLMAKASSETGIILPPIAAEAFQKYLSLAPDGPHVQDAKFVLSALRATNGTQDKSREVAAADDLSYNVNTTGGQWLWSRLIVSHAKVILRNDLTDISTLSTPCSEFVSRTTAGWDRARPDLKFKNAGNPKYIRIVIEHKGDVAPSELLQHIKDACAAQQAEEPHREQLDREEAERQRKYVERRLEAQVRENEKRKAEDQVAQEAAAAKRTADFRAAILQALSAAEEPEPFARIRGDFDLNGSDSHQWQTNLKLPDAEKCALVKTPPNSTSGTAWTYTCMFRASGNAYAGVVKSLQSVLDLPYQPDENAANINQVFFADPTRPAWRIFVSKINEATIGISIVAVRSVGGVPALTNAAPFPAPTVLPTAPSISQEIEKVRNGRYTPLPPIQSTGAPSHNGMGVFEVKNNTPYTLTALFSGPIERRVEVPARGSISIELPAGSYKLVGRVDAPNVLPSYGEHVFDASSAGLEFYIQ